MAEILEKGNELCSGKTKTIYETSDAKRLIMTFRDDATAFNALKKANLAGKGKINNIFNTYILQQLEAAGIETHLTKQLSDTDALVKRLDMIPVECVVRNIAAGSICKRLGTKPGFEFNPPLFEFFYKDDELGDPLINEYHVLAFGWASKEDMVKMTALSLKVNEILVPLFDKAGLILVDYKLEFGRYEGRIVLGDEFTPDGCRIWDKETREVLDKDRFRQDLGDLVTGYQMAAARFGIPIE